MLVRGVLPTCSLVLAHHHHGVVLKDGGGGGGGVDGHVAGVRAALLGQLHGDAEHHLVL